MALSNAEKKRIIILIEEVERKEREFILSGVDAFTNWLEKAVPIIWEKIKQVFKAIARLLDDLIDAFLKW